MGLRATNIYLPIANSKLHYFFWTVGQELLRLKIKRDANTKNHKKENSSEVDQLTLSGSEATRWSLQQMLSRVHRPRLCCLCSLCLLGTLASYCMKLQSFVMPGDTYRKMSEDRAYHVLYVAFRTSCGTSPGLHVVSEARLRFSAHILLFILSLTSCWGGFSDPSRKVLSTVESTAGRSILEPTKGRNGPLAHHAHRPLAPQVSPACSENQTRILLKKTHNNTLARSVISLHPIVFEPKEGKKDLKGSIERRGEHFHSVVSHLQGSNHSPAESSSAPGACWQAFAFHSLSVVPGAPSCPTIQLVSKWIPPSMVEEAAQEPRSGHFNLTDPTCRPELRLVRLSSNSETPQKDYRRATASLLPPSAIFQPLYSSLSHFNHPNYNSFHDREAFHENASISTMH